MLNPTGESAVIFCSFTLFRLIGISVVYLKIVYDFHNKPGKDILGNTYTPSWFLVDNSRMS